MASRYIRIYNAFDLDGLPRKVLTASEYGVWTLIRLVASTTLQREGYLEWAENNPLSITDISNRIREKPKLVQQTIDKCIAHKLLEYINNTLHIVNWESDQLSKQQREQVHKNVENGKRYSEMTNGKPMRKDFKR